MSTATSSARYTDLYDYCRAAEQIDHDLINQADRLADRLNHFEATCRESSFRVGSDSLGPALRSYGVQALPVDRTVRTVGERFERADACWASVMPSAMSLPDSIKEDSWLSRLSFVNLLLAGGWVVDKLIKIDAPFQLSEGTARLLSIFAIHLRESKIPGNVGVSASGWARWLWGLNARYAKLSTIANTMFGFRHALTHIGVLSVLSIVPASLKQIKANAQQYALDPIGMAAANVIDLEFIAVTSLVGVAGGAKIGAVTGGAIGTLILPGPGTAVGVFIGGVVGGVIGGWVAGKAQDAFFTSDFRENMIAGISHKSTQLIDTVQTMGQELSVAVDKKAEDLSNFMTAKANELVDYVDSTVDEGSSFINSMINKAGSIVDKKIDDMSHDGELGLAV